MPKLTKQRAKKVEAAEGGSFDVLDDGMYVGRLREVTVGEGNAGPYWQWVYEIPEGFEHAGRRFWNITSLSEKADWKMKETFDAFGVPADTDTDELCGQLVLLSVSQVTQQKGKNAGKLTNQVDEVLPYDPDAETIEEGGGEEEF